MEVKSFVTKNDKYKVEIEAKYTFDEKKNLNQFKELFEVFRMEGYVKAHSFSDLVWYLPSPTTFSDIDFHFDLGKYHSFRNSLKSYVLIRRKSGSGPSTIKNEFYRLKNIIISTNGLQDEKKVKEYFLQPLSENELYVRCITLAKYLSFNQIPIIRETVLNVLQGLKRPESKNRDLPIFQDVLTFDECVYRYFSNHSIDETFKWYPILIWWDLTNKIPMRPVELRTTNSNCLQQKEDGTYWITIPRHKEKSTDLDETSVPQTIQIDEKTYKMIREFQIKLALLDIESDYLIPQLDKINSRLREPRKSNEEAATYNQFHHLLEYFYEEVVEGQYGEHYLDKITLGDTRHFAIMNLFLQGFNILSISRMAGHDTIESPANYYTHAKHYATSAVYKLAQRKIEGDIGSTMKDGFFGWRDKQIRRAKHNLDDLKKTWRKVDYGYCRDTDGFPNNCVEECRLCQPYFLFKPSVNEWEQGIDWFENFSKKLEEDAVNTLNLMAMVSTNSFNFLKGLESMNENESKSLSVQFFKYLDHKAIIDAKILEEKLKERYPDNE